MIRTIENQWYNLSSFKIKFDFQSFSCYVLAILITESVVVFIMCNML